jgi:uncharacterized protein (DUF2252 family)
VAVARSLGLPDPPALADRQLELDRERTSRFPFLLTRKLQRMSASPLAFLRGAAPLFYEMLKTSAHLADGPPGEGWLIGDLHLENFGAYRAESKDAKTVFNLNDFDDAIIGPWRFDVVRLTTSLLLGGRELGASGIVALELSDRMLDAYVRSAFDGAPIPEQPAPVKTLVDQVRSRPKQALLDARTRVEKGGKRRFIRGLRYVDLDASISDEVPKAFAAYVDSLPKESRPKSDAALDIVDSALRIAGTGSLGGLRVAVLVAGKSENWIFDLKEQGDPSASVVLGAPKMVPAERVATGFRACIEHPARMIGTTTLTKLSMFGRRLAPQEDKLNYRGLKSADLPAVATYLGALLGAAHARGATKAPKTRWSKPDLAAIRERAITLAGIHEAVYLALSDRMRELLPPTVATA